MTDIAVPLVMWLVVGAFAACGLSWVAWWRINRELKRFTDGPPAEDAADALAERQAGERRHWTARGR